MNLVRWMLAVNITISILDRGESKNFIRDSFNFFLYSSGTYKINFLHLIEAEERSRINEHFKGNNFCLYLDKTCDASERYILNVFGKVLNNAQTPMILIESVELSESNSDMFKRTN